MVHRTVHNIGLLSVDNGKKFDKGTSTDPVVVKVILNDKILSKEIQNGAVAKSCMSNGLLIYGEIFAHFLIY
jgi:hypothetical protein